MVNLGATSGGIGVQITFDQKYVYAGINGYAACMDVGFNPNIQYFNKITDASGASNVVLHDGKIVLANKGGLFLLDDKGQTVASYDLTEYDAGGASLGYVGPRHLEVGIGPNDYFLYLSISD